MMARAQPYRPFTYLAENAARRPQAPAVYEPSGETSFSELLTLVRSWMVFLRARSVAPGDVVAVSLPNSSQYVAVEIAVPAVGAVLMPLAPSLGAYELDSSLRRSRTSVVVVEATTSERLRPVAERLPDVRTVVEPLEVGDAEAADDCEPYPTQSSDIVQIALTSGTTGPPKLASLSAELKQLTFEGFTGRLGITPADRVLPLSPVSQGVGEMCLYALRKGAGLVMTGESHFSPGRSLRLARKSRATVIGGVPTMVRRLLDEPAIDQLDRVRVTAVAGAPMPAELAKAWEITTGAKLCGFYGAMDIGQLAVASPDDPADKRWTTVGRPHERAEMMVCDPQGRAVAKGTVGEICMRGPLVQARYWADGSTPYAADGWAHFGDLGFVDEDGYVHVIGRTKDIVIRGGDNINPHEVEGMLLEHPKIVEACVVGLADEDLGERPVACLVLRQAEAVSIEEVREFLGTLGLARYKWPEELLILDELPVGSTGKVIRQQLRDTVNSDRDRLIVSKGGSR
jgi:acyl-CoA synthetase (AMP-forming)/AMP-acid ligase II